MYFILYHRKYYSYADSDLDSSDKRSMVFHNLYKEGGCYGKLDSASIHFVSLYDYVQITPSLWLSVYLSVKWEYLYPVHMILIRMK